MTIHVEIMIMLNYHVPIGFALVDNYLEGAGTKNCYCFVLEKIRNVWKTRCKHCTKCKGCKKWKTSKCNENEICETCKPCQKLTH